MGQHLGRVVAVRGSQLSLALEEGFDAPRVGALVKIGVGHGDLVAAIGEEHLEGDRSLAVLDLLGEIVAEPGRDPRFRRGITEYPALGAAAETLAPHDAALIYAVQDRAAVTIGTVAGSPQQPVRVGIDELLTKHFAVLGSTGSGKSCAVALLLAGILEACPYAHIVLLDPHNEYANAFPQQAELIDTQSLQLPFWLLTFEEAVRIVLRPNGENDREHEIEKMILQDAIVRAKRGVAEEHLGEITVDTPLPYRLDDLVEILQAREGKLEQPEGLLPSMRLRARLESLRADRRLSFMFGQSFVFRDTFSETIGRILRIPVADKPLAVLDLSRVPSEVVDVVVSVLARLVLDFAIWARHDEMPPVLLVCEEAHRYVPAHDADGLGATRRAITRIAKEGRKYGVSLGLVSQRPSEISAVALSQCGTIVTLRLGNELDQRFVAGALPYAAVEMLAALPSLATQEAIVSGEGVPVTVRVRFRDLPAERRPRSEAPDFWNAWQSDAAGAEFRDDAIRRWRTQERRRAPR